ncbi:uncharacterized protein [Diadema antillarum]|uniref:uncharacterized protein isoform X1 n=1 Tax=Diadema antillarum TaxID=105358 RepID=UPI003A86168E
MSNSISRSASIDDVVSFTAPLSELELLKLSEEINPHDWPKLCFRLGLSEQAKARAERESSTNFSEAVYRALVQWRETKVESEERGELGAALISCGLRRLDDRLCRGFPDRYASVMSAVGQFCSALNVERCRSELATKYRTSLCMIQLVPWDPKSHVDMDTIFTDVCLLTDDTSSATKERVSLPGSYNDILSVKMNNAEPRRILVEGKAGSGKTTLMSKFAYDWLEGVKDSPLVDVSLLFCLQLRFVSQNTDFGDAVVEQLLPEDTAITALQIEEFVKSHPDKVLIVLDGYDEFQPDIQGIKGTGNILRIIENRRLTGCRVIVTCRPWKAADFQEDHLANSYVHMAIEGFSTKGTKTFIQRYFHHDLEQAYHLFDYLRENSAVRTVTPFPLFCAMLCQVWKDADESRREKMRDIVTLSKLFDYIFTYLWGHHHKKQSSSVRRPVKPKRLSLKRKKQNGNEVGLDKENCLKRLGKIALQGLISPEKRLQFTAQDFKKCPDVFHAACAVGLLVRQKVCATGTQGAGGPETKSTEAIAFFHKLAQEKCAGIYLSSLCTKQPKRFVQTLKNVFILARAAEFRYVLQFACGEDLYTAKKILRHMPNISPYQKISLECNFESQSKIKSNKRLSKFFTTNRLFLTGRPSGYSFNALEYFLNNSGVALPETQTVSFRYLSTDGVGPFEIEKIVKALNAPHFESITKINIEHSRIMGPHVKAFVECLSRKQHLEVLEMNSCTVSRQFVGSLLNIPEKGLVAMESLCLPVLHAKWSTEVLLKLPEICPALSALQATFSQDDHAEDHRVMEHSDWVSDQESEEEEVRDSVEADIDEEHSNKVVQESRSCAFRNLKTLAIRGCTLDEDGSHQIARTLSASCSLEKLQLGKPSLFPSFYSEISTITSLRDFSVTNYTSKEFRLADFLRHCPNLEDLYVATAENQNHDVSGVVKSLTISMGHTPMLRNITLWFPGKERPESFVTSGVFEEFCNAMKECTYLSKLFLWHVPLGTQSAISLLEAYREQRNITVIRLSRCYTRECDQFNQLCKEVETTGCHVYVAHGD